MEKTREQLLKELNDLGYNQNGRKIRTDKGKIRGPNSKPRSDKGFKREKSLFVTKEKISVYLSLRNKLLNKPYDENNKYHNVQTDINDYYLLFISPERKLYKNYSVVLNNKKTYRTVKNISGNELDLERYRFNALQEKAINEEIPDNYKHNLAFEIEKTGADTWLDLFIRFYHLKENEFILWTYDTWKIAYNNVCDMYLENDYVFDYNECKNIDNEINKQEFIDKFVNSREYILERAHYRNKLISEQSISVKRDIMNDEQYKYLSMFDIDKLVRKRIDNKSINIKISEHMKDWLEAKLKEVK